MSHRLEQQALALFDDADRHQISPGDLDKLRRRLEELAARVTQFINSNNRPFTDRRARQTTEISLDLTPTHTVWFVRDAASQWSALMTQLEYFGIKAEVYPWQQVPADADELAILLLDTQGMTVGDVCEPAHVKVVVASFMQPTAEYRAALRAA